VGTSFFWVTSEILSEFPPRPGTAATYKDTEDAKEEAISFGGLGFVDFRLARSQRRGDAKKRIPLREAMRG
jgi:hypothetical protein